MKLGIGIDTGGTYTDVVAYDFDQRKILHSAKSLTTKENLSLGIGKALDQIPSGILKKAEVVSLSTTLATNACVEGRGGIGKLIFIGADREVVERTGKSYGLPDTSEIYFLDGKVNYRGEVEREPDWSSFIKNSRNWFKDAEAVAVVQQLGVRNSQTEEKAKSLILEEYGLSTVCGHELFSDLNYIKRGASTLLNARLIPVIENFLKAIKRSLKEREINAPVVIVRSDGSLMSEEFTALRPVETLLCGPAASALGGIELTGEKDSVIVDMGGTTTDMAIVKNGVPEKTVEGVKVGKWKTFVKAVHVDTFALGGDTRLFVNKYNEIDLDDERVVPLCIAAANSPSVVEKLRQLRQSAYFDREPMYEFYCLSSNTTEGNNFSDDEIAFLKKLKREPLMYSEVVNTLGRRFCFTKLKALVRQGIVMRCGFTPTDVMHVKGDFTEYRGEASLLCAEYLIKSINHLSKGESIDLESFCEKVYDLVKGKLYFNIVRMMLEKKYPNLGDNGLSYDLVQIIKDSWTSRDDGIMSKFSLSSSLVGVGAPIHVFLPDVAKALNTTFVIPKNAAVANALGAVVGNVRATSVIRVKPDEKGGFIVFNKSENQYVSDYQMALSIAQEEAKREAVEEAKKRGAVRDITVTVEVENKSRKLTELFGNILSTEISATAIGRIDF